MKEQLLRYQEMIATERTWSWAVIALVCFIAVMIIRGWFLKPLVAHAKKVNSRYYQQIKAAYIKKAMWGWLSLLISIALVSFMWTQPIKFPLTLQEFILVLGALITFFTGLLIHLTCLGVASLKTLKKAEEDQKVV